MTKKHTLGPWELYDGIVFSRGKGVICELSTVHTPTRFIEHIPLELGSADWSEAMANGRLIIAAPDLLSAMPTLPHPGGRLVKVVAHYEDGSTQTIDGEVVTAAAEKARGGKL